MFSTELFKVSFHAFLPCVRPSLWYARCLSKKFAPKMPFSIQSTHGKYRPPSLRNVLVLLKALYYQWPSCTMLSLACPSSYSQQPHGSCWQRSNMMTFPRCQTTKAVHNKRQSQYQQSWANCVNDSYPGAFILLTVNRLSSDM